MALTQGDRARALISAAVLAGTGAAFAVALPAAWLLCRLGWMGVPGAALFTIGCALTGLTLVLDKAFVGRLHSRLQLYRSALFSVLKLLMLIGATALTRSGTAILLTWIVAPALSLAVSWGQAWKASVPGFTAPDFRLLAAQVPTVIDHRLLNLAAAASALILPLVVRLCPGPAVNAAFYAGWMIVTVGLMVPASLTTVLFTVGTTAPFTLPRGLRLSALISLVSEIAGAAGLATFPDDVLGVFNPAYPASAASAVRLLGLGLLGEAVKQRYILVRLRRRMLTGAAWLGVGACFEVGLATLGGTVGGVLWLTRRDGSSRWLCRPASCCVPSCGSRSLPGRHHSRREALRSLTVRAMSHPIIGSHDRPFALSGQTPFACEHERVEMREKAGS